MRKSTAFVTSAFCLLAAFAMVACQGKNETNETNESQKLSYQFKVNGCNTGKKEFSTKEAYCAALVDDSANNFCASSLRQQDFERQCKTQSKLQPQENADQATLSMPEPNVGSNVPSKPELQATRQEAPQNSGEVCNSPYKPSLVLKPLECETSSEIIILAETHFDPIAIALKDIAKDLGGQKDIYSFIEDGSNFEDNAVVGNAYGLEENLVNGISSLQVGLAVLDAFSRVPAIKPEEKQAVKLSVTAFTQGFFKLQSLWGDLSWMPANLVGAESSWCIKNIASFRTPSARKDQGAISIAKSSCANLFETSMEENRALFEMSLYLIETAKTKINQDPKYSYLTGADAGKLLGPGRDLIFAKNILGKYCEASKLKKNIWIQLGRGHAEGVQCLLKTFLPANTKVTMRHPEDFSETFKNWPTDFSATSEKVNQYVIAKGSDVKVRTSKVGNTPDFLMLSLDKVPAPLKISEVKKIINDDGYLIINWRSNPGDIDFFASLAVTFDPFKVK